MGTFNTNPVLDSRVYVVHYLYGTIVDYSMNILIENIFANVDEQGYMTSFLEAILITVK